MRLWWALAWLLVGLPAHAGTLDVSLQFEGMTRDASLEAKMRAVLTRAHHWYDTVFDAEFPAHMDLPIRILADRRQYDLEAADVTGLPHATLGFFSPRTGGVVWRNPDTDQLLATVVHEAGHHFIASSGLRAPRWLNEGICEVFERYRVSGNAVWLDPEPRMLAWMRAHADDYGITATFIADARSKDFVGTPVTPTGGPYHGHGWTLSAFLMATPHGKKTIAAIARHYTAHRGRAPIVDAIDATYPGGGRQLDIDFRNWWRGKPAPLQLPIAIKTQTIVPQDRRCDGIEVRKGDTVTCVTSP